jgi:4-amino-4-deoxy-L-arabinose transferase-like glycosyltransferase
MLLRHDWVTLYANGIRYLEKAPLLYWAMAACMAIAQLTRHTSAAALAIAARIPLALTVLALAFAVEAFARHVFRSTRAGLYAALILLSSFGIFLFTRITIPDAMLCLWLTLALFAFRLTEANSVSNVRVPHPSQLHREGWDVQAPRRLCYAFAACCALAVLTKGLIGLVFPIAIVATHILLTRGPRAALQRLRQLHPISSTAAFLAIAVPWHILIALANPTQGHPANLAFTLHPAAGAHHWQVPLPAYGQVHGWAWFYFINEQLLRYLNLRVPHDYDTVPLYLFLGLILIWLMPWSAFLFQALAQATRSAHTAIASSCQLKAPKLTARDSSPSHALTSEALSSSSSTTASSYSTPAPYPIHAASSHEWVPTAEPQTHLLLLLWAAIPLLFFSLSTRQEYYVLPSLPPLAILLAAWLAQNPTPKIHRTTLRATAVLLVLGTLFATATTWFLLHTQAPAPNTDLSTLLQQNPADYAMSLGHFLDLNAQALALFRLPLALAAAALFLGPLASYLLRRRAHRATTTYLTHAANLALAAGAFTFLLAAHQGLRIFAPILSSQQLAAAIAPQLTPRPGEPAPLLVIHQEYEYASTLSFYLQRPTYIFAPAASPTPQLTPTPTPSSPPATSASSATSAKPLGTPRLQPWVSQTSQKNGALAPGASLPSHPIALNPVHILTDPTYNNTPNYGRSSNLWYGSFFPDAPAIFETTQSLAAKWHTPQRIFLWQDLADQPSPIPAALTPIYVIARSGGKEIVSNQPNHP